MNTLTLQDLTVSAISYIELKRVPYSIKDLIVRSLADAGIAYINHDDSAVVTAIKQAQYFLHLIEAINGTDEELEQIFDTITDVIVDMGGKLSGEIE